MTVKVLFSGFEAGKFTVSLKGVTSSFFFRAPAFFTTCEPFDLPTFEPFFTGLAFFDGDTDNLYRWGIHITRVAFRNGHQHIQSFHNLAENSVFAI